MSSRRDAAAQRAKPRGDSRLTLRHNRHYRLAALLARSRLLLHFHRTLALLGRFLSQAAAGDAPREAVKAWVAIYKECQTFAFLPYQLLFSVTLILFPMLARAQAEVTVTVDNGMQATLSPWTP